MEKNSRLSNFKSSFRLAIGAFVFLTWIGFGVAGIMSFQHYSFNHEKTVQYYLGDPAEGEIAFKKPYSHLVGVTHVHAYTMPLVFFVMWILLQGTPSRESYKKWMVIGGSLAIITYNIAPYVVRSGLIKGVWLFTLGGIGLYLFYFWPSFIVLRELFRRGESS